MFTAFNRWLEEDWGFDYQDRIFAAPYISLADVDWAVAELEWALDNGARTIVHARRGADHDRSASSSPADPYFDPFWARVNEAGITVVVHAGDSGYSLQRLRRSTGFSAVFGGGPSQPRSRSLIASSGPIYDFLASLCSTSSSTASPTCASASVENGAEFLADLFDKLRSSAARCPASSARTRSRSSARNVWINPFWEDDVLEIVDLMGADRVIFGSDWPHIEGMPQPARLRRRAQGARRRRTAPDRVGQCDRVDREPPRLATPPGSGSEGDSTMERPTLELRSTVLGSPDPRRLAAFYERLLGWERFADEQDWVTVRPDADSIGLAFQTEDRYVRPVWPAAHGEQQMTAHLDIVVEDFPAAIAWALEAGATEAEFQPQADVRVMLDPDGHPFCLFPLNPG